MRMLWPTPTPDVDPLALYADATRPAPDGRPWVLINMVASVDGATTVGGRSGGLGTHADQQAFRAIRAVADVVLVAAGTMRAEGYGPPKVSPRVRAARMARGQAPVPRLAIVTGSLDLDPSAPVFAEAEQSSIVVTGESADPARVAALEGVAEVVRAGRDRVDPAAVLAALAERGASVVLCEGGPSLNGQLVAADLVDEVCLTLAPGLVGGPSARVAHGGDGDALRGLELAHVLTGDGALVLRYLRRR